MRRLERPSQSNPCTGAAITPQLLAVRSRACHIPCMSHPVLDCALRPAYSPPYYLLRDMFWTQPRVSLLRKSHSQPSSPSNTSLLHCRQTQWVLSLHRKPGASLYTQYPDLVPNLSLHIQRVIPHSMACSATTHSEPGVSSTKGPCPKSHALLCLCLSFILNAYQRCTPTWNQGCDLMSVARPCRQPMRFTGFRSSRREIRSCAPTTTWNGSL